MKIPNSFKPVGKKDSEGTFHYSEGIYFEPNPGEKILVKSWVRYPSYDFIFGVPDKSNPHYELEFGFFQFRKLKNGNTHGWSVYLDKTELLEFKYGFSEILKVSKAMRKKEWREGKDIIHKK